MVIYCPNCNKVIKDTCEFCPHCGLRIYTQKEIDNMGLVHYPARFKQNYNDSTSYEQESYEDNTGTEYTEGQYGYDDIQNGYVEEQGAYGEQSYSEDGYGYSNYGYVQPNYQPRSKSSIIYIATILILLLVIFAGAGYFIYSSNKNKSRYYDEYMENTVGAEELSDDPSAYSDQEAMPAHVEQVMPYVDDEPVTGAPVVKEETANEVVESGDETLSDDTSIDSQTENENSESTQENPTQDPQTTTQETPAPVEPTVVQENQ